MRRALLIISTLILTLTTPLAAENVEGYLVDKMCSAKILKGGADAAKAHSKDCALAPNCKASGFGVLTSEGKFLKFDADGDRMAEKMIGFASGKDNLKATVNGKVDGDSMTVVAIQLL